MNKTATSKEELLETAKEIAYREGISKLSIRRVASDSSVAIGTVYNYYPAKEDLILAVMEDFWRSVFHRSRFDVDSRDFVDSFGQVFHSLKINLKRFETSFLKEASRFSQASSAKGRQLEEFYWNHMKEGMLRILSRDGNVSDSAFAGEFTREAFIEFAFSNLIILLQARTENCDFVQTVFRKLLY